MNELFIIKKLSQGSEAPEFKKFIETLPDGSTFSVMIVEPSRVRFTVQPYEKLLQDFDAVQKLAQIPTKDMDTGGLVSYCSDLTGWTAYLASIQAGAKFYLEMAKKEAFKTVDRTLSASMQRESVNSECYEFAAFYEAVNRVSAAIVHNLDFYRTVISRDTKIELAYSGSNNT